MRSLAFAVLLAAAYVFPSPLFADIAVDGEHLTQATTITAGSYQLDVFASGINASGPVFGWQFEMDFSDPNLVFSSWTPDPGLLIQLPVGPVEGTTSGADFVLVGGSILFGATPSLTIQDGMSTRLGSIGFNVQGDTQLVEIPIGGVIEFNTDPAGNPSGLLTPVVPGAARIEVSAIPEPGSAFLISGALACLCLRRGKRRFS